MIQLLFTSAASAAGVKAVYVPAGSYKITGSVTSGSFFTLGSVTIVGGTVNVLDVSKPKTPKAHHSLSVLNAEGAALSRYALTQRRFLIRPECNARLCSRPL